MPLEKYDRVKDMIRKAKEKAHKAVGKAADWSETPAGRLTWHLVGAAGIVIGIVAGHPAG